jgi:RNase P subunit RPR2
MRPPTTIIIPPPRHLFVVWRPSCQHTQHTHPPKIKKRETKRAMPPKKKGGNQRRKEEIAHNRLEYLWQISLSYATTMPSISRFYVSIMWEMGKRLNYRLDNVTVKSCFCKKCYTVWIPGKTVQIRQTKNSKRKRVIYTCLYCKRQKRYGTAHRR